MTFKYDSRWLVDAPRQRFFNIWDSLRNNAATPLLLIGHSFGRDVTEQVGQL
ncbi:uncharacterized protein BO72DRAFT_492651 [Aspergillus fijiensis CBS 313.89]|uniref:Alpha/beta hydrolase n=1 Tax=Aspergillus fijiensis CBS 313.89 TaxID=1448319 RepID=A0A8G1RX84_9EURO|nr:uncharacterized protein BO72DRAFT_492651 [Aspergillus fijiensis CBS 313.89]RAK81230.1 hypothetical protein BO72DRAFT_492651 [Aspergillus fijiensis CBS 313.89]